MCVGDGTVCDMCGMPQMPSVSNVLFGCLLVAVEPEDAAAGNATNGALSCTTYSPPF